MKKTALSTYGDGCNDSIEIIKFKQPSKNEPSTKIYLI